jgi:hypothetical protein
MGVMRGTLLPLRNVLGVNDGWVGCLPGCVAAGLHRGLRFTTLRVRGLSAPLAHSCCPWPVRIAEPWPDSFPADAGRLVSRRPCRPARSRIRGCLPYEWFADRLSPVRHETLQVDLRYATGDPLITFLDDLTCPGPCPAVGCTQALLRLNRSPPRRALSTTLCVPSFVIPAKACTGM